MTIEVEKIGVEEMRVIEGSPVIIVYESPADFPGKYVARLVDLHRGNMRHTEVAVMDTNLKALRDRIPIRNMVSVPWLAEEDPCIVETWI